MPIRCHDLQIHPYQPESLFILFAEAIESIRQWLSGSAAPRLTMANWCKRTSAGQYLPYQ